MITTAVFVVQVLNCKTSEARFSDEAVEERVECLLWTRKAETAEAVHKIVGFSSAADSNRQHASDSQFVSKLKRLPSQICSKSFSLSSSILGCGSARDDESQKESNEKQDNLRMRRGSTMHGRPTTTWKPRSAVAAAVNNSDSAADVKLDLTAAEVVSFSRRGSALDPAGAAEAKLDSAGAAEAKLDSAGAAEAKLDSAGAAEAKLDSAGAAESKLNSAGSIRISAAAVGAQSSAVEVENDKEEFVDKLTYANGDSYSGVFLKGKPHGFFNEENFLDGYAELTTFHKGDATKKNTYWGYLKNGKKEGEGFYLRYNGDCYSGSFSNGFRHGKGCYEWHDGEKYVGDVVKDKMHGHGEFWWPDEQNGSRAGCYYKGEFKKGNINGAGCIRYRSGRMYEGQWENGFEHGVGKLYSDATEYRSVKYDKGFVVEWHGDVVYLDDHGTIEAKLDSPVVKLNLPAFVINSHAFKSFAHPEEFPRNPLAGIIFTIPKDGVTVAMGEKGIYKGVLNANGLPEDVGLMVYLSGDLYMGEFHGGIYEGFGIYYFRNGEYYVGSYYKGRKHGYGVYTTVDKKKYYGSFKNGKAEGKGLQLWPDGRIYIGMYSNGFEHGLGLKKDLDGSIYYGEFSEGICIGDGWQGWINGNEYEGGFLNGLFNGKGCFKWEDGRKYVGDWLNGEMDGWGQFDWPGGRSYKGQFKEGKRNGTGTMKYPNGTRYVGQWKDGHEIGVGKLYRNATDFVLVEHDAEGILVDEIIELNANSDSPHNNLVSKSTSYKPRKNFPLLDWKKFSLFRKK